VRAKIRLIIKISYKTKKSEIKKWDIDKINKKEVKEETSKAVKTNVQNTQLEDVEGVNEMWNKMKKGINEATGKSNRKRRRTTKK